MCLRLLWRREGNTHRVSQACPEHEPSTSTTHSHKHTHTFTDVHLPSPNMRLHSPTYTQVKFYRVIIKFADSQTGCVDLLSCFKLSLSLAVLWLFKKMSFSQTYSETNAALFCVCACVIFSKAGSVLTAFITQGGYRIRENATCANACYHEHTETEKLNRLVMYTLAVTHYKTQQPSHAVERQLMKESDWILPKSSPCSTAECVL